MMPFVPDAVGVACLLLAAVWLVARAALRETRKDHGMRLIAWGDWYAARRRRVRSDPLKGYDE
jgi:hypothetical protein